MENNTLKKCPTCKLEKTSNQFYKNKKRHDGLTAYCIPCYIKYYSKYGKENFKKRKLWTRKTWLKWKYNISNEEYNILLTIQNSVCKICGNSETNRNLAVDHCHITGNVRGLLCDKCNRGLGCFGDDPILLCKAADYLKQTH
ncbi:MAG TPA: endonuclease VII domain-containing protein [Methylomirabilota bacterium]|nr:endonuclease VII domain-containing protein [Methylomirabilota bacterium]